MDKEGSIDPNQLPPITREEAARIYANMRYVRRFLSNHNPIRSEEDSAGSNRPRFHHPRYTPPRIDGSSMYPLIPSMQGFIAKSVDIVEWLKALDKNDVNTSKFIIDSLGFLDETAFNNKEDNTMNNEEKLIRRWEESNIEKIDEQRDIILEEIRCDDEIHKEVHEHIEAIRDFIRKKGYGECLDYHLDSIDKYEFSENNTDGLFVALEENRDSLVDGTRKWADETIDIVNVMDTATSKIQALIARCIINDTYEIVITDKAEITEGLDPRNG